MNMMKTLKTTASLAIVALMALGITSCKGRTNDNVEPTGDTVEVTIAQPDEAAPVANYDDQAVTLPDTIAVPD